MQGKMKTFKDTEAEKEGDKVNVIFLILASSDYFGVSRKSCLGTRNGILEKVKFNALWVKPLRNW